MRLSYFPLHSPHCGLIKLLQERSDITFIKSSQWLSQSWLLSRQQQIHSALCWLSFVWGRKLEGKTDPKPFLPAAWCLRAELLQWPRLLLSPFRTALAFSIPGCFSEQIIPLLLMGPRNFKIPVWQTGGGFIFLRYPWITRSTQFLLSAARVVMSENNVRGNNRYFCGEGSWG